jgi:probable HAF family extracellular repeat protein
VVGVATTAPGQQLRGPGSRAVLWQGGRPIDLGTLGGDVSEATAVNDAGQVVGVAAIPPDRRAGGVGNRAVLWANGQITDLGTLPGGDNNRANDVNSRGEAVGIWLPGAPLTPFHAALWAGGRLVDLGTLPGAPVSRALAINDAGQIAGRAADAPEGGRPPDCPAPRRCVPILHRGGAWVELPTLPGFPNGSTTELNNAGQVVGQVQAADGASRAVLWAGDAVIDLNTAIPAGSGWVLTTAFDINEGGQIVGAGTLHGQRRGFLLSPAATPGLPDTGAGGAPVRSPMTGALLALGASLVLLGAGVAAAVRRRGRATVA